MRARSTTRRGVVLARQGIARLDRDTRHALVPELARGICREVREYLDAVDRSGQVREAGGEIAGAGADLEHAFAAHRRERLQDPSLEHRRQHPLAVSERNGRVRERDRAVRLGHVALPRDGLQGRKDTRVQHGRRANLLFDHLPPGGLGFGVHHHYGESRRVMVQAWDMLPKAAQRNEY